MKPDTFTKLMLVIGLMFLVLIVQGLKHHVIDPLGSYYQPMQEYPWRYIYDKHTGGHGKSSGGLKVITG